MNSYEEKLNMLQSGDIRNVKKFPKMIFYHFEKY